MSHNRATFEEELRATINRCSMENGSNTPDWILARYMSDCLDAFNASVIRRETWYGRCGGPGKLPLQGPGPEEKPLIPHTGDCP